MKWLKIFFLCAITFLAFVLAWSFISQNDQRLVVDLWMFKTWPLASGLWLLLSFTFGLFIAQLLALPGRLWGRFLSKRQTKRLAKQQQALSRLKGEALKGK